MKRVTINNVNAALKGAGIDAELVRGKGYFYFAGPAMDRVYDACVCTMFITDFSVQRWVDICREKIKENE